MEPQEEGDFIRKGPEAALGTGEPSGPSGSPGWGTLQRIYQSHPLIFREQRVNCSPVCKPPQERLRNRGEGRLGQEFEIHLPAFHL